jgi:hypothetical protein
MISCLLLAASGAAAAGSAAGDPERFRTSLPALLIAGLLIVVALYLTIRLLEWDLINKDTEDQDDPLQH